MKETAFAAPAPNKGIATPPGDSSAVASAVPVAAGHCDVPDAVHVEQKDGWGPLSTGYRLNCVGHVAGYGRSYQVEILSTSPNGFTYGKATINRVSRIVYDALDRPLV